MAKRTKLLTTSFSPLTTLFFVSADLGNQTTGKIDTTEKRWVRWTYDLV